MFSHIAWAMKARTPDALSRWLLVILADHANEQGTCFPSQSTLATRTGMGRSTVNKKLLVLEEAGLIKRKSGCEGRSTIYTLIVSDVDNPVSERDNHVSEVDTKLPVNNKTIKKAVPDDWQPSEELIQRINSKYEMEFNHVNEADRFCNYHISKGSKFADVNRAYQNWCSNAVRFAANRSTDQTNNVRRQARTNHTQGDKMRGVLSHFANKANQGL